MPEKIILIGDDDREISDMYKFAFEKAGFKVLQAYDGEEIIKMAKVKALNAILLDINMPKKDGFAVLKEIGSDDGLYMALKSVPIIMLSNYSNAQDIEFCMKNGAQDFIVKAEWDPESIIKRVNKQIEKKKTG